MTKRWGSPDDVRTAVRKRWNDGTILREQAQPGSTNRFPLRVPLGRPTRDEIVNDFAGVTAWARDLIERSQSAAWTIETRRVSAGKTLGSQAIPWFAHVDTVADALTILGPDARRQASDFARAWQQAEHSGPWAAEVAAARPLDVIEAGDQWPMLLAITAWLIDNPRPGIEPRLLPVPGAHTKVIERNRALARRLFDAALPADTIDDAGDTFDQRYGFTPRSPDVTLRGHGHVLGLAHLEQATVTWPLDGLAGLDPRERCITQVVIVENLACLALVPSCDCRLAVWGKGKSAAAIAAAVPWLPAVDVAYWGDLDTWGYSILDDVRAVLPLVRSVLMDEATAASHMSLATAEPVPFDGVIERLTSTEAQGLALIREGQRRIEQEHLEPELIAAAFAPESQTP